MLFSPQQPLSPLPQQPPFRPLEPLPLSSRFQQTSSQFSPSPLPSPPSFLPSASSLLRPNPLCPRPSQGWMDPPLVQALHWRAFPLQGPLLQEQVRQQEMPFRSQQALQARCAPLPVVVGSSGRWTGLFQPRPLLSGQKTFERTPMSHSPGLPQHGSLNSQPFPWLPSHLGNWHGSTRTPPHRFSCWASHPLPCPCLPKNPQWSGSPS